MIGFGMTVLGSGSSGNASIIHGPEGNILLDAGFSAKELERRMEDCGIEPDSVRALLLTHEHSDHTKGCRVFADRHGIDVYMTSPVCHAAEKGRFLPESYVLFSPGDSFDLCGVGIKSFTLPHDALDTVGFVFRCGAGKIGVATDLGHVNALVREQLRGCTLIMLESNHDPEMLRNSPRTLSLKRRILSRHGHLCNEDACAALEEMVTPETHEIILAHISSECNDCGIVEDLGSRTLAKLKREDILLKVALQDSPLGTFHVDTDSSAPPEGFLFQ
ncbi:MAG: MBL fold metallo-hydrolase [Lentisphaeria bacterium]|nr:MBL fold metallo-hydrolase [Lentisphaeria bacterium]